jgi:glycosyltransferase involved in cell wall biosynthesis
MTSNKPPAAPFAGFDVPPRRDIVLSVVIPVYNERHTLPRILRAVMAAIPDIAKEIIVVDDQSRDGTSQWLKSAFPGESQQVQGARCTEQGAIEFILQSPPTPAANGSFEPCAAPVTVRPIFHTSNLGKGGALRTGFAAATGDVITIQDSDLEYNPAEFAPMLRLIQIGVADVVFGSRFCGNPHRTLYFHHYIGNRLITILFNLLFNQMLTDVETCYKMFRREVIQGVTFVSDDFGIEIELSAAFARPKRWRLYEIGVSYYGRTYAEGKKIGWRDGIKALWYVVKFRFSS